MWVGEPHRSRWQIAAGLSRIDTMDRRSKGRNYCSRNDNCEDCQSHTGGAYKIEIVVHRQHLLRSESMELRGADFR
jgi:hypothetical protein